MSRIVNLSRNYNNNISLAGEQCNYCLVYWEGGEVWGQGAGRGGVCRIYDSSSYIPLIVVSTGQSAWYNCSGVDKFWMASEWTRVQSFAAALLFLMLDCYKLKCGTSFSVWDLSSVCNSAELSSKCLKLHILQMEPNRVKDPHTPLCTPPWPPIIPPPQRKPWLSRIYNLSRNLKSRIIQLYNK